MMDPVENKKLATAIFELKKLLERHHIPETEWAFALYPFFGMFGYTVNYHRKKHLHIVVNREKILWHISDHEKRIFELMLPLNGKFAKEYRQYIDKTGFDFDILAFSASTCRALFKNSAHYKLPDTTTVQIMTPLANIAMESKFWKLYLNHAPEKLERIIGYYRQILAQAIKKKDTAVYRALGKLIAKYKKPLAKKLNQGSLGKWNGDTLVGQVGNSGSVHGRVGVVKDIDNPRLRRPFDIIVARMSSPRLTPFLMRAKGLITDEGGQLCHAVIISRELKIPCVIGTKLATKVFKDGDRVEVDATRGVVRRIK